MKNINNQKKEVMKTILIAFMIIVVTAGTSLAQTNWEDVVITRDKSDVENMVKLEELSVSSSIPFAGQKKLRKKATEKLKQEAFEKGIYLVLIEVDNFSATPINNVNLVGTGYRKKKIGE